ncbi:MAG: hypothetical protein GY869_12545, partial [Planctomycetes bacterium]|nr:hypothetical protein [Planctomycetota bacterium]
MKKKIVSLTVIIIILALSNVIYAFCVFSNSDGYFRKYLDQDLPFIFQPHISTPENFLESIDDGAEAWENVVSTYWEIERGDFTTNDNISQNGINLLFFDIEGVNFEPGTSTIAFSMTYTAGIGSNYRALESDLAWNSRDYPPSPTGAPGFQDLQSVITHEFGHHLGMAHTGPNGSPPGCGETISQATMFGSSSAGDTTGRSLHIHDIGGVSVIYPHWIFMGHVFGSSGELLEGVYIESDLQYAAYIDEPEPVPGSQRYHRAGYSSYSAITDEDGFFWCTSMVQEFTVTTGGYFGFLSDTQDISFDDPGGIGSTQEIEIFLVMEASPYTTITGTVIAELDGNPIQAEVRAIAVSDKAGLPAGPVDIGITDDNGNYSLSVPIFEDYDIVVYPEVPYYSQTVTIIGLLEEGETVDFQVRPADLLLVNDEPDDLYTEAFTNTFTELNASYYEWKTAELGSDIPMDLMPTFNNNIMIWFTGDADDDVLSELEITKINN